MNIWPVLIAISVIVERQVTRTVPADEIPSRFDATGRFVEAAGSDGGCLIVCFEEYEDTAFCCDRGLESQHRLREDAAFTCSIERRNVDELGGDALWIGHIKEPAVAP